MNDAHGRPSDAPAITGGDLSVIVHFTGETPIGTFLEHFSQSRVVFERFHIDVDALATLTLQAAVERCGGGIDLDVVLDDLALECRVDPFLDDDDYGAYGITELVAHITELHHRFLFSELPRLAYLIERLAERAHNGNRLPFTHASERFQAFVHDTLAHMHDEERYLFPSCRLLDDRPENWRKLSDRLQGAMRHMEEGHGVLFADFDAVVRAIQDVDWTEVDDRWRRTISDGLVAVREDLRWHSMKEDEILLPDVLFEDERLFAQQSARELTNDADTER